MYQIVGADGKEYGPVSAELLRQWLNEGRVNGQTRVRDEGATEWKTLAELPGFAAQASAVTLPPVTTSAVTGNQTCGMAIAGLVMGILALVQCCSVLFGILGIIFSCMAISQINKRPTELSGKNMAKAGLIMSIVGMAINIVLMVVYWGFIMAEIAKQK